MVVRMSAIREPNTAARKALLAAMSKAAKDSVYKVRA